MTELQTAEARAAAAKARLHDTVGTLQDRLQPRRLARSAAEGGRDALVAGAEAARANPAKAIGAAALLGLVLGRHRVANLLREVRHRR